MSLFAHRSFIRSPIAAVLSRRSPVINYLYKFAQIYFTVSFKSWFVDVVVLTCIEFHTWAATFRLPWKHKWKDPKNIITAIPQFFEAWLLQFVGQWAIEWFSMLHYFLHCLPAHYGTYDTGADSLKPKHQCISCMYWIAL